MKKSKANDTQHDNEMTSRIDDEILSDFPPDDALKLETLKMPIPIEATDEHVAAIREIDELILGSPRRGDYIAKQISENKGLVVLDGKRVVAYALWDHAFFGYGFFWLLCVHPQHRRQGIATSLIAHIESMCRTEKIFISTNESNKAMQAVLAKASYIPTGRIENLDEGDPELFYFKSLDKNTKGNDSKKR